MGRMAGEQSNEEKLHLEAKIKDLQEELEQRTTTHSLLSIQIKRLQVSVTFLCFIVFPLKYSQQIV